MPSQVGRSIPCYEAQNQGQYDRADHGNDDAHRPAVRASEPKVRGYKAANERANDADNDIHQRAIPRALHQFPCYPPRDKPDDDPRDDAVTHGENLQDKVFTTAKPTRQKRLVHPIHNEIRLTLRQEASHREVRTNGIGRVGRLRMNF